MKKLIKKLFIILLIFSNYGCAKKIENKISVDHIAGTYITDNQELYITLDQNDKTYQMKHVIGNEIYEGSYFIEDDVIQFTNELSGYILYPSGNEIVLERDGFKVNLTLISNVPIVSTQ